EPMDVRFTGAEITAFDRVVEETEDGIAIVLIVLRGVDSPLRRDRMGAARGILEAKTGDLIPQLGERGGGGRAGEPRPDHEDVVLGPIRRRHETALRAELPPFVLDGPVGY